MGAITASAMTDHLVSALYGDKKSSDLAAEEKRLVSSLVSIAGGLAGAAVTDGSVSMAATASETAKVEVENNTLSPGHDEEELEKEHGDRLPKVYNIARPGVLFDEDGKPLPGTAGLGIGAVPIGGKSKDTQIWTETKKAKPVGNAYGHWTKHGKEFPEYQNAKQYVDAAHNFMTTPPQGTLTKTRPNGDTLYYNPATNVFASKDINGVPRTMFKPEKGLEYWKKQ
ncbi:VENN motif pre-toxin domain-containing protein [Enterobacter roggenkampii]